MMQQLISSGGYKIAIPMWASTSEITVGRSAEVWETLGTILASRSILKTRAGDLFSYTCGVFE